MLRLRGTERFFISEDLIGYVDKLTDDGAFPRRVDFLLLGFSYAVVNKLPPADEFKRHSLGALSVEGNTMLAIEATAHWYARELNRDEFEKENELMDFICSVGIAGARELKKRWQDRTKSQIQMDIMQLIQ